MSWPLTGATHYHAQLGLPDKGCSIKRLVVCNVVWLGSMKGVGLRTCTWCVGLIPCCGQNGYRAQVAQLPIETYHWLPIDVRGNKRL